jgi:NADH-quinone oxidoreductase subunit A
MDSMLSQYLPIGILILVAIAFSATTLIISSLTSQKAKQNPAKDSPYECGLPPITEAHTRFSVKFYLVAMLFILFDIEVVFMYPWAVVYKDMLKEGMTIFFSMLTFLGILFVGFLYAVKKGAFDWK